MKGHLRRLESYALKRTLLANERTLLAHLRAGFASFLFGLALTEFAKVEWVDLLGYGFLGLGVLFFVFGVGSYLSRRLKINSGE